MSYELPDAQLRDIFEREIQPAFLSEPSRHGGTSKLLLVIVGGQPGAGKSMAIGRLQTRRGGLTEVIGDDLRNYHPDYDRLMRDDPLAMPEATAQASGRWVGMALEYLRVRHINTLIETTLRQPAVVRQTLESFRQSGYSTELHVVAAPAEVSRLGTITRYIGQVERFGAGRWTPSAAHDAAAQAVPGTVAQLVTAGLIDELAIENRRGDPYYLAADEIESPAEIARHGVQAIELARDPRQLDVTEAQLWLTTAAEAVGACVRTRQSDADLLATLATVVNQDADVIAEAAYPNDQAMRQEALQRLRAAYQPLSQLTVGTGQAAGLAEPSYLERQRWAHSSGGRHDLGR